MTENQTSGRLRIFRSSILRLVVFALIAVILLVVISNVAIRVMKAQRNQPIDFTVYPNAKLVTKSAHRQSDSQTYSTTDSPQQVLNYYSDHLSKDEENGCKKIYLDKEVSDALGHYVGRCAVSSSLLDAGQLLAIKIDYVLDADGKTGKTIIQIDRSWGG